jgi:thioredoxin reductase (NADPH)
MTQSVLMAVADDGDLRARLKLELRRRYHPDYEIVCEGSIEAADAALMRLRDEDREVAVVLADQWISGVHGLQLLSRVRELHPHTQRGMLVPWGERSVSEAVRRAAVLGQFDFWTLKPWRSPDEEFHSVIGAALREWARSAQPRGAQPRFEVVRVVGEQWAARSHEIRDLLSRNNVPHGFYSVSSDRARDLLERASASGARLPVVVLFDELTLVDPTNAEVAEALGVRTGPQEARYDVVVVGAGPSGLAASVYATSEGLHTAMLEREAFGGQAGTTSLIRNYLGFPRGVSGGELAGRAYQQAWLFGTEFVYGEATGLRVVGTDRVVTLADGSELVARAVVLANGVAYRRLGVPALDALSGAGVFYGAAVTEAQAMAGERVFVVGGGNSAGQAAVHLAKFAAHVTLLVRGPSLADSMSDYLIRALDVQPNIDIRYRTEVVDGHGDVRLEQLTLLDREAGRTETVASSALFVLIGAAPRTDWLPKEIARDRWGFVLTGNDLGGDDRETSGGWTSERSPLPLETSLAGVFAVGDVRHGSVKRVASAVGEGSVSVRMVHDYLAEQ